MTCNTYYLFARFYFYLIFFGILFCFRNCSWTLICKHIVIVIRRWRLFLTFLWFITKIIIIWEILFLPFFNLLKKTTCNQSSNIRIVFSPLILVFLLYFTIVRFIVILYNLNFVFHRFCLLLLLLDDRILKFLMSFLTIILL